MARQATGKAAGADAPSFNVMIVGQQGRLAYEAVVFLASLRDAAPKFKGKVFVAVPQAGPLWPQDPAIKNDDILALIEELGGTILPFTPEYFGANYPYGNKIEALMALPEGEPFVFFDTDTLILEDLARIPFNFDRPGASLRVEGTWPQIELYGPGYGAIWKSLYDRFGLDFDSSLDLSQPDEYWKRYLYLNAGVFWFRCPREFGRRFLDYAKAIHQNRPEPLILQSLDPWLDQVALPLVIHSFGGGRDVLPPGLIDGEVTCHWRTLPLLYARESDRAVEMLERITAPNKIKKVLKNYDPFKKLVYQGKGAKVRAMFDRADLPRREQAIRNQIKSAGLWMR
ncbi:MAG: hypothetical protein EBS68_07560 [Rhodobacteraceae bacterium]|nr:hypothetical protein [Paracoccaceae bacterium]